MNLKIPMLDIPAMHAPIRQQILDAITQVVDSASYIGGKYVQQFEADLAAYTGAKRAVGVSSGSDALIAALMALDVKPGDEIITSSFTFFATAGAIVRLGAKPVFVDIDPVTFNIDPKAIGAAVTSKTVGIIPVHLFGQSAEMQAINALAAKHKLWVIEDAAQSIGSLHHGKMCGTMSTVGIYSFFPAKNLGCLGDGGACVTNDASLADKLDILRNHGMKPRYYHKTVGGNFRLDAMQAAVLSVKLPHLKSWENMRRTAAATYTAALSKSPLFVPPVETAGNYHVFNQYELRVRNGKRDAAVDALNAAGIGNAIYYPVPLHLQECFASLGCKKGSLPITEQACDEVVALPVMISPDQCREIISVLQKV